MRSEKARRVVEGRGFDSRHLHCPISIKCAGQSPSREGLCSRQDTLRTHQDTGAPVTIGSQRCRSTTSGGQGQAARRRARRRSTRRPLDAWAEATTRHRSRPAAKAPCPAPVDGAVLAIERVHEQASERGSCPARPQLHEPATVSHFAILCPVRSRTRPREGIQSAESGALGAVDRTVARSAQISLFWNPARRPEPLVAAGTVDESGDITRTCGSTI
jgi:hypothetical protein